MKKTSTASLADRIAGAPASWGICEVPGWGHQLSPEQVLSEMREVGFRATELGPDGFLPDAPEQKNELLASFGLSALGAFCPIVLHDRLETVEPVVTGILNNFRVLGAATMVIAAATPDTGYDARRELDDKQWTLLLRNLEHVAALAAERGVQACIHPHVGTLVESRNDVNRVLDGCTVPLCLDTGHLLVGGSDPVELARQVPQRIAHVHLKDVDLTVLEKVRSAELTYTEAVAAGMYKTLGRGAIDLKEIVRRLESSGYQGWYVPEQDRVLQEGSGDSATLVDARASVDYLKSLM